MSSQSSQTRRQILEQYEKKGVDLPIVTLEMVLERESNEAAAAAAAKKENKKGLFGRFGRAESKIGNDDDEDQLEAHYNNNVGGHRSFQQRNNIMEVDEENIPFDAQEVPPPPPSNRTSGIGGAFCCPQPSSFGDKENALKDGGGDAPTVATETGALQSTTAGTTSTDPSLMFCCSKNQTVDDQQYHKSNLQLAEGGAVDENGQYRNIMNKGSLIDGDDSVMTTNTDYRDEVPTKGKGSGGDDDERFWGSSRFRWTMIFCCLLHVALISMIIVVARNARKNNSIVNPMGPPATTSTNGQDPSSSLSSNVGGDGNVTAPTEDCVDKVELSSTCYGTGSNVLVYFRVCTPQAGDWMAVFDATDDATNLLEDDGISWMYTCGDRSCEGAVASNVIHFNAATLLPAGATESTSLRVHMMREGAGSTFSAIASTQEFKVVTDATNC